jgi:phosphoribosylformylglycinamidine cyclo-ligase
MLVVVPSKNFKKAESVLDRAGETFYKVGRIVKGERKVSYS